MKFYIYGLQMALLLAAAQLAHANVFKPKNFLNSELYLEKKSSSKFVNWLSTQSNLARLQLEKGEEISSVLENLTKSRVQFHQREFGGSKSDNGANFGMRRLATMYSGVGVFDLTSEYVDRFREDQEEVFDKVVGSKIRTSLAKAIFQDYKSNPQDWRPVVSDYSYKTIISSVKTWQPTWSLFQLKGKQLNATQTTITFAEGSKMVGLTHVSGSLIQTLLTNSFEWYELAAKTKNKEKKIKYYLYALHCFFHAMPYERGTASIGRALWQGVGLHLFGKPLPLPDTVDLLALTLDYDCFTEEMTKLMHIIEE